MAVKFKDKQQKSDYERFADKVMQWCFVILFPIIIVTVFQFTRGVFSLWSIVASVMAVFLFFCARGGISKLKNKDKGLYYEESYGNGEEDPKALEGNTCVEFIGYVSKKQKVARILIGIVLIIISSVLFTLHGSFLKKNPDATLTTAYVVTQVDKTWYEYDRDSDGETTVTEHAECDVTIKFQFNGEVKEKTVRFTSTGYVASNSFKIYIDKNGDYLCTYDSLSRWNGVGILLVLCAVALMVSGFVKIGNFIFMPLIFTLLGGILMIVFGGEISFIEMLLHEMTCFFALFALLGVDLFVNFFIVAFTIPKDVELVKPIPNSGNGAKILKKGEKEEKPFKGRPFDGAGARIIKSANDPENQFNNEGGTFNQEPVEKICSRCGAKVTVSGQSAECPYCNNHINR